MGSTATASVEKQKELPGGSIGPDSGEGHKENRWTRPGHENGAGDTWLERTSVRWHDRGWYVITTGDVEENGQKRRVALRRSGPYGIDDAEVRLMSEAGRATQKERVTAPESLVERVDAIIHEGFRERLRTAARRWLAASEAEEEDRARAGREAAASWERQAVLEIHNDNTLPKIAARQESVIDAANAYREWTCA